MNPIKINFLDDEVAALTFRIARISSLLKLDTIVNQGLTRNEWRLIQALIKIEDEIFSDEAFPPIDSVLEKVSIAIKT